MGRGRVGLETQAEALELSLLAGAVVGAESGGLR